MKTSQYNTMLALWLGLQYLSNIVLGAVKYFIELDEADGYIV